MKKAEPKEDGAADTSAKPAPENKPKTASNKPDTKVEYRVVDSNGKPIEGVVFNYGSLVSGKTNGEGVLVIDQVAGRGMKFALRREGYLGKSMEQSYGPADSPVTIMLREEIDITVKVYDAETNEPLKEFKLSKALQFTPDDARGWNWRILKGAHTDGNAEQGLFIDRISNEVWPTRYLLEADGYIPVRSKIITPGEVDGQTITLEFPMVRKAGQHRYILTPDGEDAARAVLSMREMPDKDNSFSFALHVADGKPSLDGRLGPSTLMRADRYGKLELPLTDRRFTAILTHETGYLELMDFQLFNQQQLKLKPWKSMKVKVLLRDRPVDSLRVTTSNGPIILRNSDEDSPSAYGLGQHAVRYKQETSSDEEGVFDIGFLPDQSLSFQITQEQAGPQTGNSVRAPLEWACTFNLDRPIEEGQEFVIGDDEIDVIGKLALPENKKVKLEDGKLFVTKQETSRTSPFSGTTTFCRVNKDGTFRIPNLKPGHYYGRLVVTDQEMYRAEELDIIRSYNFQSVEVEHDFQISPEMFEGKGPKDPIDLGEVKPGKPINFESTKFRTEF
ncbi:MAG: hypothetical protein CMJ46_14575 [Planctomyces sp.]|nr:hypothetical protein [Planctomyces sp.]